jgi:transcriptional regulator of arginine metabolism
MTIGRLGGEAGGIVAAVVRSTRQSRPGGATRIARDERHRQIRELVARDAVENQQQLADLLTARGHQVTQATVSRDVAALGLVKMVRGNQHIYAAPDDVARVRGDDAMLHRVLRDIAFEVRQSGLVLLLVSTPGSASILAEAIDRSTLEGPEGTVAGDNTVLVLFADVARLERWRDRLAELRELATG